MNEINQLYKTFLNKKILILTKKNLHYRARVLDISDDVFLILDKFQNKILLPFSEISQITEIKNEN